MEPLRTLPEVEAWNSFSPSMEGYLDPKSTPKSRQNDQEFFDAIGWSGNHSFYQEEPPFVATSVKDDLPNPGLLVDGFGRFSVSCSPESSIRLISHFEDGTDESGALNIDASKLNIANPRFHVYIQQAASELLSSSHLRAELNDSSYSCQLQSLALRTTKECTEDSLIATSSPAHFATVVVVLSSEMEEGSLVASLDNKSTTIKLAEFAYTTTIIGWYTGIHGLVIQPPSTGPVAFLTYHLVAHSDTDNVPGLHSLSDVRTTLRDRFLTWRQRLGTQSKDDCPNAVVLLLQEAPSKKIKLKATGLNNPKDVTLLAHIAPLCKAYGFTPFFMHMSCNTSCPVEFPFNNDDDEYYDPITDDVVQHMQMDAEEEVEVYAEFKLLRLDGAKTTLPTADFSNTLESAVLRLQNHVKDYQATHVHDEVDEDMGRGTLTHARVRWGLAIVPREFIKQVKKPVKTTS